MLKELEKSQLRLEQLKSEVSSTEAKLAVKKQLLTESEDKLDQAKIVADTTLQSTQERVTAAEERLKLIVVEATKAAKQLNELKNQEDRMRRDLAARMLELDKREEVIERKERLLSDTEQKVAEFNRFMKL